MSWLRPGDTRNPEWVARQRDVRSQGRRRKRPAEAGRYKFKRSGYGNSPEARRVV